MAKNDFQYGRWLWDYMPCIEFAQTSAILEFYIWFRFRPHTAVDMSFYTSHRNFILGRKK